MKVARTNWKEFCQEPPLTDEEWEKWADMVMGIQKDDELCQRIADATRKEWEAEKRAEQAVTEDWSDLVAWADAGRRLRRAEIRAHKIALTGFPE